jgi:uncharacterized protein YuzE
MKITYDPYADALSISFKEGKVKKTIEIAPEVNLDVDAKSRPLYLEILGVREKIGKANAEEVTMKNIFVNKSATFAAT